MAVGLTFRELLNVYFESFKKRQKEIDVEQVTAQMGLNPFTKNEMEKICKAYDIPDEQILAILALIMPMLDTITANNESIAKAIDSNK